MLPDCFVYTFEASFNGCSPEVAGFFKAFSENDYMDLGRDIILAMYLTFQFKYDILSE